MSSQKRDKSDQSCKCADVKFSGLGGEFGLPKTPQWRDQNEIRSQSDCSTDRVVGAWDVTKSIPDYRGVCAFRQVQVSQQKKTRKSHPCMRSQQPGKCHIPALQTRKDHSSLQGMKVSAAHGVGTLTSCKVTASTKSKRWWQRIWASLTQQSTRQFQLWRELSQVGISTIPDTCWAVMKS